MSSVKATATLALSLIFTIINAQSNCPSPSGNIRPTVASGYSLQVVATGLSRPRGLAFDGQGHLLVVEQGSGTISSHVVGEANGCVTLEQSSTVVDAGLRLNHGIWVQENILYASNPNSVYAWTYDAAARTVSDQVELINGMNGSDHSTRTLLLSRQVPGMLVTERGSNSNLDFDATTIEGGTAQVRAFNLNNRTDIYDWQQGQLLAWGTRNEVGLVEHPVTGGIWGVENSADQIHRDGVDVSNNNPAEELNFFGYLNGTPYENQGGNFGYPWCLTAWEVDSLPNNQNLSVGDPFAFDQASSLNNQNRTDEICSETIGPRLSFQAHMAPLDIKFNNSATEAWIAFHGSWNRAGPIGYKVSVVQFGEDGTPVDAPDSRTAAVDIVANIDNSVCPQDCFRPVAMAFDSEGRIFMTSDSTGEIYLITRTVSENSTSTSGGPSGLPSGTSSGSASATASSSAGCTTSFTPLLSVVICSFVLLFLLSV